MQYPAGSKEQRSLGWPGKQRASRAHRASMGHDKQFDFIMRTMESHYLKQRDDPN